MGPIAHAQEPLWVGVFENKNQSSDGIQAAIETAVAKMNFIKRPIARSRLKKTNEPHKKIVITQRADVISVAFDDRKPVQMPADGRPIKWTRDDGEVFDVSVAVTNEGLVQTFTAEDGQRVNTFSANDAGQMTMEAPPDESAIDDAGDLHPAVPSNVEMNRAAHRRQAVARRRRLLSRAIKGQHRSASSQAHRRPVYL